jgi:ankyrin repeat protein
MIEIFLQSGFSALHRASERGHTAVAQLLIESQAKLDIKSNVSVELLVACMGMGS